MSNHAQKKLKGITDRPWMKQEVYKIMDTMVTELSLYMNPIELDKCMDFLWTLEQGEFDLNMSVGDCEVQLKLILGSERYEMIREKWKEDNTRLMSVYGKLKYKSKKDGKIYDGLDPEDDEKDYEKVYV
tara:strand:+ start:3109 stop:3495 length:387 start_codon:yes stop_codon:yes gene_type:complete